MGMETTFNIGDPVECTKDHAWQDRRRSSDIRKARKLGKGFFMGTAAAYMHLDEAYIVEGITKKGGLKIRGFAATVSPKHVRISTKSVNR